MVANDGAKSYIGDNSFILVLPTTIVSMQKSLLLTMAMCIKEMVEQGHNSIEVVTILP